MPFGVSACQAVRGGRSVRFRSAELIGTTGVRGRGHDGRVDLDAFVRDGYVAVRGAVDACTAAACRELIWTAMELRGVCRDDPGSWPPLVEGIDDLAGEPFVAAYMAPTLTAAYDELIGPGRWERSVRSVDIGEAVVVRFPAGDERANAGYHIEGSYAPPDGGSGAGWVNIRSRARGLLALFLSPMPAATTRPPGCYAARTWPYRSSWHPTARRAPIPTPTSGDHRRCAGRPRTPPGRRGTFSCAIRSWCTQRLGRTEAPGPG
jgi:hypothetical protein